MCFETAQSPKAPKTPRDMENTELKLACQKEEPKTISHSRPPGQTAVFIFRKKINTGASKRATIRQAGKKLSFL